MGMKAKFSKTVSMLQEATSGDGAPESDYEAHKGAMEAKDAEKTAAEEDKAATTSEKEEADKALGEAEESKALEEAKLADDQAYLKDLTMQCELKAREFDQHSKVRADEVAALEKAMEIVESRVKSADEA